jgi:hypothetical protein
MKKLTNAYELRLAALYTSKDTRYLAADCFVFCVMNPLDVGIYKYSQGINKLYLSSACQTMRFKRLFRRVVTYILRLWLLFETCLHGFPQQGLDMVNQVVQPGNRGVISHDEYIKG